MRVAQSVRRQVARWQGRRWLLVGLGVVALMALVLGLVTRLRDPNPQALAHLVGRPAPVVFVPRESNGQLANHPTRIGGATGRPQLLVFFFTLCPHCLGEVSVIQVSASQHAFGDAQVTYIDSPGERPDIMDAYAQRVGIGGPVLLDTTSSAAAAYHVRYFPSVVLIDAQGVVRNVWCGEVAPSTLTRAIAVLAGR